MKTRKFAVCPVIGIGFALLAGFPVSAFQKSAPAVPSQLQKPATLRADYVIKAGVFYEEGKNYGFNVNSHAQSFGSRCVSGLNTSLPSDPGARTLYLKVDSQNQVLGSRCDFTVFEPAQLKNGFVFKSFTGSLVDSSGRNALNLTAAPSPGSTSMKFLFHGWAEPGGHASYHLLTITLEGPSGRDWREALR